jgi:hypothetical protein
MEACRGRAAALKCVLSVAVAAAAASARASSPVFHARAANVVVPAGGVIDLGLPQLPTPTAMVLIVTGTLGPNAELTLLGDGYPWVVLDADDGPSTPISFFDIDVHGSTYFRATLQTIDDALPASAQELELTFVPIDAVPYDFIEPSPEPVLAGSDAGWQSFVQLATRQAGAKALLAACAAQQTPVQQGLALRLTAAGEVFPSGRDAGDFSYFYTRQAHPQSGFLIGVASLGADAGVALESRVNPPDGTPMGSAQCPLARVAALPVRSSLLSSAALLNVAGVAPLRTASVDVAGVSPLQTYVVVQQVFEQLGALGAQNSFVLDGQTVGDVTSIGPASASNLPVTKATVFAPAANTLSVQIQVKNAQEVWGASVLVFGPFDGGVIELLPLDGGASDAGMLDAGAAPRFLSTPPGGAFCQRTWVYMPKLDRQATLRLSGGPAGAALDGGTVSWTPRRDQEGPAHLDIMAEGPGGTADQPVDLVVPPCRLDFTTQGCGCSSAGPVSLALLLLVSMGRRAGRSGRS